MSVECEGVRGCVVCVAPAPFPSPLSSMLASERSTRLPTLQIFVPPERNSRGAKHNIELGGGGGRGFLHCGRRLLFSENRSPNIVLLRYACAPPLPPPRTPHTPLPLTARRSARAAATHAPTPTLLWEPARSACIRAPLSTFPYTPYSYPATPP